MSSTLSRLAQGLRGRQLPTTVAPTQARPVPVGPAERNGAGDARSRRPWLGLLSALALVAYGPLLLTQRGWVSADTKTYLYLDPSRVMSKAWSMWDPAVGMGTVTHQYIGYLWPIGPFYWVFEQLGVPDWAAQRIWWGTIVFAAGAGVVYLLRTLGWRGPGVVAATFVYALTPYVLTLVARLSVILLPFSALPWLVALTIRTARTRGWRHPALFALTVATCGSVNATALLLVGVAPALWLAHAVWVAHEITLRTALRAALRIGVLTVPVSAWWIAGLTVQATNGIEILRYTETARTVAAVSVSHEVLRGLGYWFFYGGDRLGPWIEPSRTYTQSLPLIALTYLLPIAGLAGGVVARWRHRAYFVMLTTLGVALAVGAYPWDGGSAWSRAVQAFVTSDIGLSMRSLPRAVPLVALGLAVLGGAGVTSLARRWPRTGRPLAVGVALVAVLALPPLWLGRFVPENLRRLEELPAHWNEAASHLDARDQGTRVLVVPGSEFAAYRWGNTVDPILPGLIDRPSVQRELVPLGSAPSANLLNAFDLRLQENTADPDGIAPVARLMRAGDVLVQSDLEYERYKTPAPRNFWDLVSTAPGLGEPVGFGPGKPNVVDPDVPLENELLLQTDPELPHPPELAALPVTDPVPIVSTHATDAPVLVAGDGAGLVDAAGAGLIDGTELIRYSASLGEQEVDALLDDGAVLLLTDSNRRRGERWTAIRHTRGFTESADTEPLEADPSDNRLPVFPDAESDTMTVAEQRGPVEARATSYGNPATFTSEERPALAVDGDLDTAWGTAAFSDARGERIELTLDHPVTTGFVTLVQPVKDRRNRFITEARLTFDGGSPLEVTLGEESRGAPGQRVTFEPRTFRSLSIEILADTAGDRAGFGGQSSIGFSEIVIGEEAPTQREIIALPRDLLDATGSRATDHPLAIIVTRQRQDPTDATRSDEEQHLARAFSLPEGRAFSIAGDLRLFRRHPARVLDEALGRPHDGSVTWVRASSRLDGDVQTAAAAFDGDPGTAWTTKRGFTEGEWVEVNLTQPVTVDRVPLTVVADDLHSLPRQVEVTVDGRRLGRVPLAPVRTAERQNATAVVDVPLPEAVTGSTFRFRMTRVRARETHEWTTGAEIEQPIAIAEIGLPGPTVPALPGTFDTGCRDDLLALDGEPVAVRAAGAMAVALAGDPLPLSTCSGGPLVIDGGEHEITAARGDSTGLDLDRLVLRSDAGGGATGAGAGTLVEAATGGRAGGRPEVTVVDEGPDHSTVRVSGAEPGEPFWLVLGQSFNPGWAATTAGGALGEPVLVDGFANGWLVTPESPSFEVALRFAPQQRVNVALVVSLVAAVACLALAIRRPRPAVDAPSSLAEPYSSVLAFRYEGALPSRGAALWTALGVGALGLLLVGPAVGVAVGVAAGLGARHETFRRYLLLASPVALGLCALYVLYIQVRWSPPAGGWPIEMRRVHPLGWLAVLLLVADVIVDRVWQSRRTDHD